MTPTFGLMAPLLSPLKLVNVIVRLETLGFDRVWMPDHVLYPEPFNASDAWSVLAAAAVKTTRIQMGTAVSDPHRSHPAIFAQRIATVDQLSKGRVLWGLGAGEAMNLEPFGIPWDKPVGRLKEFVQVVRGLLESEEPFSLDGMYFQVRDVRLGVRPFEGRKIPMWLAALGPVMQKFAGQMADGWMPVVVPASQYDEMYRPIQEAAVAAGRTADAVEKVAVVALAITEDEAYINNYLKLMGLTFIWPPVLRKLGIEFTVPPHLQDVGYASVNPCDANSVARFRELQSQLPFDVLKQFVCYGKVEDIRRRLGEYVDAGVTHFNLVDASPDPVRSMDVLATEVLPWFRPASAAP